jgi:TfoX/Sxy family transcriptional regulator of competence genes
MASNIDFVNYVIEQIDGVGDIRSLKMFGEYCIYINDKPVIWICDNTVFVKKLDCVKELLTIEETGFPYPGAKEFYVLDPDDGEVLKSVAIALEKVLLVPKKKKKKSL